eukprot:Hpha_TRINITY_DN16506_c1_g1::TRINITY_DN16506_c1_g1_i10::g.132614::m.132614
MSAAGHPHDTLAPRRSSSTPLRGRSKNGTVISVVRLESCTEGWGAVGGLGSIVCLQPRREQVEEFPNMPIRERQPTDEEPGLFCLEEAQEDVLCHTVQRQRREQAEAALQAKLSASAEMEALRLKLAEETSARLAAEGRAAEAEASTKELLARMRGAQLAR